MVSLVSLDINNTNFFFLYFEWYLITSWLNTIDQQYRINRSVYTGIVLYSITRDRHTNLCPGIFRRVQLKIPSWPTLPKGSALSVIAGQVTPRDY